MKHTSLALVAVHLAFAAPAAWAELPLPRLAALSPAGARRGTTVDLVLAGSDLEGLSAILSAHPGIAAVVSPEGKVKLTVAPDAPTGMVDLLAAGTWGVSHPRRFHVSDLPQSAEKEPNNLAGQATVVAVDSIVDARTDARADVDYFRVELKRGQRVFVELLGERIDSRIDGVLTLLEGAGPIAMAQNNFGGDPFLDFTAPADGAYVVKVHDLLYNGGVDYFYRLAVHSGPVPEYVYPPACPPGGKLDAVLVGRALPSGRLDPALRVGEAALETIPFPLAAPADALASAVPLGVYPSSRESFLDRFVVRPQWKGGIGVPLSIGFAAAPLQLEKEPNDTEATAQVVPNPVEIVGRCDQPGDVDWFRFSGKANAPIRIEAMSERAGFPTDLYCLLRRVLPPDPKQPAAAVLAQDVAELDDDPRNLGRNKFPTDTHDPLFAGALPADGDYLIAVRDRYAESRGDARCVYRVRIAPPNPGFRLLAVTADEVHPSSVVVRQGGTAYLHVLANREGGMAGPIKIEAHGLPPGLSAPPVEIAANQTEAALVLIAEPTMAPFTAPIEIRGTAMMGDRPVVSTARVGVVIRAISPAGPNPARLTDRLVVAGRENAPYRLTVSPAEFHVGQGAQLNLALKLERRWPEFEGALEGVTAASLPPGLDNAAAAIPAKGTDGMLHLYVKPDAPPGTYSFFVIGAGQVPFTKTPNDPKAQKANVPVADPSPPIALTVVPRPIELAADNKAPPIKIGQKGTIKLTLKRHNNFSGPVKLSLVVPPSAGAITAPEVLVPADKAEATLEIAVAAGVAAGDKAGVVVRGQVEVASKPVHVDERITVKVVQ